MQVASKSGHPFVLPEVGKVVLPVWPGPTNPGAKVVKSVPDLIVGMTKAPVVDILPETPVVDMLPEGGAVTGRINKTFLTRIQEI